MAFQKQRKFIAKLMDSTDDLKSESRGGEKITLE